MLVPEQARLVRVPFVLRVACVVKRWFPKRHRDTRFPTSTIIQLWHFQPPLFFFPLSPSLSLSLFCPFFIRATIEKPWTVGSRVEFSIAVFFLWIFLWTSVDFTRREGGLNNTKNERRMHNADFTTSLCVRGDWRDTANRIILSNEICEIDVYYVFIRFAPVRFFVRRREMEFTFRTSSIFSSASKNK